MGHDPSSEVAVLRAGIDLGMTVLDTAEMYADGCAEEVVAQAVKGCRDDVFVVSKVHPANATEEATIRSCEASLRRLDTDWIDLYLLHWRLGVPLSETVSAFERLHEEGKIGAWGVSNFNVEDIADLPAGSIPAADQVLYNLMRRGPEADLLPLCAEKGISVMAYSPIEKGLLLTHPTVRSIADERGVTASQIALAWVVRNGDIVAIPKAASLDHVRQNAAAMDLRLTSEEVAALDEAFPAPGVVPLETLS